MFGVDLGLRVVMLLVTFIWFLLLFGLVFVYVFVSVGF